MDKAALLKKIRALAERGVGGEADNAEEILRRLMEKYGVSEDELDEEERRRHDFEYHGKEQEKLLRQVVYKVTGGYAYNLVYDFSQRGQPRDALPRVSRDSARSKAAARGGARVR